MLKKAGPMEWTLEAEAALQDLKKYLSSTPILVAPKPQESLLLYLAATNQVVSATLVAQREVDEGAVATAGLADGEPGLPPTRLVPTRQSPQQSLTPARQGLRNQVKWCRRRR